MSPRFKIPGLILLGLLLNAAIAQEVPAPAAPAESAAAITLQMTGFAQDLDVLRRFMGMPEIPGIDIGIRSDLPRDLYFQAMNLWQKADRLLFEVRRTHGSLLQPPIGGIELADVLPPLHDAHETLRRVMRDLRITPLTLAQEALLQTENSQTLFNRLLMLNRQLDALLERHFAPQDVYMEITLATAYASRLLSRYPEVDEIPLEPPFVPYRQPVDVYQRLMDCLATIIRIFHTLNLPVLAIDARPTAPDRLTPGDVFAVASLIVSQLDFLYQQLGIAIPPPQPIYPGLKFPAHSYQRAGILQAQLEQLERHAPVRRSGDAGDESARPTR
jgi:hypothetical protein